MSASASSSNTARRDDVAIEKKSTMTLKQTHGTIKKWCLVKVNVWAQWAMDENEN
jgi:hypothetical protein